MSEHDDLALAEQDWESGFLSRWSRRKAAVQRGAEPDELPVEAPEEAPERGPNAPGERIDPRTGKRYDELTDADMPSLETLDESSDLSVFLARNISPTLRMQALGKVFRSAKYNRVCLCAEYADDYTRFEPLGDIIPHDMKSAIAREADKLRQRLLAADREISPEQAEARVLREMRHRQSSPARADAAPDDPVSRLENGKPADLDAPPREVT